MTETTNEPINFEVNDEGQYLVADRSPMSRRQFIQYLFTEADMSRKDIAALLDLKGNQVYQATVNMENSHHGPGRGAGQGSNRAEKARDLARQGYTRPDIAKELEMSYGAVYAATKSLDVHSARNATKRIMLTVNGEEQEMTRPDAIRELARQGYTRPQIKEQLDVSYAVVWAATKNVDVVEARSNRVMVTMEDGREIPRTQAIREMADDGKSRRQIADALDLDYSVVWAATKSHPSFAKPDDDDDDSDELTYTSFTKAQLVQAVELLELENVNTNVNKGELIELIKGTDTSPEEIAEALGESEDDDDDDDGEEV